MSINCRSFCLFLGTARREVEGHFWVGEAVAGRVLGRRGEGWGGGRRKGEGEASRWRWV